MARLVIVLAVLFVIGAFFGLGGMAGVSLAGVGILAALLVFGAIAFLAVTYYRRLSPRPGAMSAVVGGDTPRGRHPATASTVVVMPDQGSQSLGRAANRYVTFLIVLSIVVMAVGAVLLFGFVLPSLHSVGETLRENREEFRESVQRNPQRPRQSTPYPATPLNLPI